MEWILSSSALILVVVLLRHLLLGKISLRLQYALWALVLIRLLVPVSFGSTALSVMNTAQRVPVVQDAETLRGIGGIEHVGNGSVEGYYSTDYMGDFPTTIATNKSETDFSRMKTVLNAREIFTGAWIIGTLIMLLVFVLSNANFRRSLKRRRVRLEEPDYPLPVYVTGAVETPCLFGLVHPTVYITPEVQENAAVLRHALEHEKTHFRHGDHFWALLRCACLVLHWFNPLVWWAAMLSRQDAELASDEGTICRMGEAERFEYGNTLIDLTCTKRKPSVLLCTATTMTGSKKSIRERVTLIARRPKMLGVTVVAVILAAALAVGCTFTGAKPEAAAEPSPTEPVVALSGKELAYFNDEFFNGENYNIHNQFLSSLYAVPEDVDLFELFYCGTGQKEVMTDEERQVTGAFDEGGAEICPTDKLSVSAMDAALTENMGLNLEETNQIGLDFFNYHREYDAYYHSHGDTNYRSAVTFTAGARRGDLVSLYYDDTFMGNGSKVVTLQTVKNGYHFVSNRYNAAPAVSSVIVPEEESVLSVKFSELSPYAPEPVETKDFYRQDWGELVDSFQYQGEGAEPDRSILVGNWPGGGICACYVVYDNTAGEDVYHRFAQLCTSDSAQNILENPDWVSISPFTDLFGYDGFVLSSDGMSRYYFFDEDGKLNLLYGGYGSLDRLFTAGADCVYAFDDAGRAHDPAMLIQQDGNLYRADLSALVARLTPELEDLWLGTASGEGVGTLTYCNTAEEQLPVCTRRVCCDGKALKFYYGDGKTYTDHLADGIDVPDDVLAAAQSRAQAAYQSILDNVEGYDDWITWNPDDWRIASLGLERTMTVHGLSIEVYTQSVLLHTATPEKVVMAGGTYITEDGWIVQDGPSGEYYILPFVVENGKRVLLDGKLANDYGVDSPAFDSDLRNLLMESNLLSDDGLTGEELIMDFSLQHARFLTRLGALPEMEMNTLCRRMTDAAAAGDDDLRSYWEDALDSASGVAGSMDDAQKHAYECLRSYVDSTGTGT